MGVDGHPEGAWLLFMRRPNKKAIVPRATAPTIPPTTPPAIAPVCEELLDDEVAECEEDEDVTDEVVVVRSEAEMVVVGEADEVELV